MREFDGLVEQAGETEIANAAARADRTGLYAYPQSGVALVVLFNLVKKGVITSNQRAVVISTAHDLKFSRFQVEYHNRQLPCVVEQYPNPPIELPVDYDLILHKIQDVNLA